MTNQLKPISSPWLSVIIPTWNGSAYIAESLESIAKQEEDRIEIIVIDDGSTDRTVDIIEGYAQRLPIRIVNREHTGNWVENTNLGLSMASGKYVSFLHQDDVWLPGRLKCLREMTVQHPEVNFFFHPSYFIDARGEQVGIWKCPLPQNQTPLSPSLILPKLLVQNFISVSAACFKRSVAEQVGFLDDLLWYTADWKFWIDLVSQGKSIYYPHPLSSFRIHSLSLCFQGSVDLRSFKDQMQRVVNQCLPLIYRYQNHSPSIVKLAQLSIEVNTALAGLVQGELSGIKHLFREGIPLNPLIWALYVKYSGIHNRCRARIRAKLLYRKPNIFYKTKVRSQVNKMNRQDIIKNICRCPYCYASLSWHHRSALCDSCRREFFQRNGKIYFSDPSPESTEEAAFLLSLLENKTPTSKLIHRIRKVVTSEYHPRDRLSQVLGRIVEGAVVVDCGSGNRRLSERAINVDLNPFENVDIVSDIKRLPFARGSVDIVIMDTVLEHVKDPQRCVDEAHRVLKTGGQVICVTPFIFPYHPYPRHYWNFSEDGIRYLFRNFSYCSVEMDMGPTSALINLLSEYFALAFKGKYTKLYVVIKGLALLPIFLLRYMDYFWRHSEKAKRIAMCLFTVARK